MNNYVEKSHFTLKGTVNLIGELVHIQRQGIPDLNKRVLTVTTPDEQVLYPELRNNKLKLIETEGIVEGCAAEIKFIFQGSEKSGKRYNNIYIHSIKTI